MNKLKYDFLVAGAGIAGICAAVSAARHGLSVILINDRSVLGGNASSEIGVGISGASHDGMNPSIYAKETGIIEEIRLKCQGYNVGGGYGNFALLDAVLFDMVYNEKNITLMLNTIVTGCEIESGKIKSCFARHTVNNQAYQITAHCYSDCTGNGILAFEAGAEFKMGRESKEEFDEYWAPEQPDSFTMGSSLFFETEDVGYETTFTSPNFAHDISKMEFLKDIDKPENFRGFCIDHSHWTYEYGGQLDTIYQSEDVDLELRKLIYGIWDYVKNSGKYPKAKNYILKRVYAKTGPRESRRFIGDYILSENDIENKVDFYDAVCIGGWPMDIHAPLGIYDSLPASNFVPVTGMYNIPFRCLYSKNINNLMLAGRDISATHIALGSTRVMATCGAMGQSIGTAAFLCRKYDTFPVEISNKHICELQQLLLNDDQTILHLKDSVSDGFTATATSEAAYENIAGNDFMPLERDYCLAIMLDTDELQEIKFKFKSKNGTVLKYKILHGEHIETYLPTKLVKQCTMDIPSSFDGWYSLIIHEKRGADGKIYIVLEKNTELEIAIGAQSPIGVVTMRMHTKDNHEGRNHDSVPLSEDKTGYTHFDHIYEKNKNILFCAIIPTQNVYSADKAINGYARPYGAPNLWMPKGDLPQTLTLTAVKPVDATKIGVIFDSDLRFENKKMMPKCLIKAFKMDIHTKDGVVSVSEKNNYLRQVMFEINAKGIRKIEITITESYGEKAGLYGIRLIDNYLPEYV